MELNYRHDSVDKHHAQLQRAVEAQRLELQVARRDYDCARNTLHKYELTLITTEEK